MLFALPVDGYTLGGRFKVGELPGPAKILTEWNNPSSAIGVASSVGWISTRHRGTPEVMWKLGVGGETGRVVHILRSGRFIRLDSLA